MANSVRVVGIHPVPADEPVHLIEIELAGEVDQFDFGEVTQELPDQPQSNWQTAYDEREIAGDGDRVRFAFFFHYLDLDRPLSTSFGPVNLPAESPRTSHLRDVEYEQP